MIKTENPGKLENIETSIAETIEREKAELKQLCDEFAQQVAEILEKPSVPSGLGMRDSGLDPIESPIPNPESRSRRDLFTAFSTVLLGSATLVQLSAPGSFPIDPLYSLIVLTYALTIFYAATRRYVDRFRWLVDLQLAGDALVVSVLCDVVDQISPLRRLCPRRTTAPA